MTSIKDNEKIKVDLFNFFSFFNNANYSHAFNQLAIISEKYDSNLVTLTFDDISENVYSAINDSFDNNREIISILELIFKHSNKSKEIIFKLNEIFTYEEKTKSLLSEILNPIKIKSNLDNF